MPKVIKIDGLIGTRPGEISASYITSQLPESGNEPIEIEIHSEGGSVIEGFAAYDAIAAYQGPKKVSVKSSAFSIASFIAMAGDEIEITPNGYLMIHRPYLGTEGDDEELANEAELLRDMRQKMTAAYAKKSGLSEEAIGEMMKRDTYLNAEKALSLGFVNRITEQPVTGRPLAQMESMPYGVVLALCNAKPSGEERETTKGNPVSESQPVAATIEEIEAAYPKAKPAFVLACLKKRMPLASVATAAVEEMMRENEELKAQIAAMQQEMGKAKSMEVEVVEEEKEEEMQEMAQAKAKGVKPIAKAKSTEGISARARWDEAVTSALAKCRNDRRKAVALARRENPGLAEALVAEANSR